MDLIGKIVTVGLDSERYFIDMTDEEVIDDGDEISVYVLPEKYSGVDLLTENPSKYDAEGFWTPIDNVNFV